MHYEDVLAWLTRRMRIRAVGTIGGSVFALFSGIAILVFTYGVVYAVCQLGLGWWLGGHHWLCKLLSMASIPLLFWGNSRDPDESELSDRAFSGSNSLKSNANPIATAMTRNVHDINDIEQRARTIASFLYIGPRLIIASRRLLTTWQKTTQVNVPECARVLCLLYRSGKSMSFQQVVAALDGLNPVEVFPQLRLIDGVRFLEREPAGIMLDSTLREEMKKALPNDQAA